MRGRRPRQRFSLREGFAMCIFFEEVYDVDIWWCKDCKHERVLILKRGKAVRDVSTAATGNARVTREALSAKK